MPKNPLDKAKGHEVVWQNVSDLFAAAARFDNATFVYFISEGDDGAVKVGYAADPVARLRQMQTGNPRRLRIEYVLLGTKRLEKSVHRLWEAHAVPAATARKGGAPRTEWFNPTARDSLFPIVADAAHRQVVHVAENGAETYMADLEDLVAEAHKDRGHTAVMPDMVYQLGSSGGYAVSRLTA